MLIDITLLITPKMIEDAQNIKNKALAGHLGTHFDVMDRVFPLEYTRRDAVIFDVSAVIGRDIEVSDIDLSLVQKDMFVAFYTGYMERDKYGSPTYFKEHPQLSFELIGALLEKGILGGVRIADDMLLCCVTEQRTTAQIELLIDTVKNL